MYYYTVCPRSFYPYNMVTYCIQWVKTSWTYSKNWQECSSRFNANSFYPGPIESVRGGDPDIGKVHLLLQDVKDAAHGATKPAVIESAGIIDKSSHLVNF